MNLFKPQRRIKVPGYIIVSASFSHCDTVTVSHLYDDIQLASSLCFKPCRSPFLFVCLLVSFGKIYLFNCMQISFHLHACMSATYVLSAHRNQKRDIISSRIRLTEAWKHYTKLDMGTKPGRLQNSKWS